MDTYSSRGNMSVGYTPQRLLSNKEKVSNDSEMDFNDVFGGPPRRSSIHEMRHSFNETKYRRRRVDEGGEGEGEGEVSRSPWSAYKEKPVFGEEGGGMIRRRHRSDDFFDDIFRGDESPKLLSSLPGSRVLSPARPLPPKADPFASSSAPSLFSLPEKLNKGIDLPAFASVPRSPYKKMDGASNGTSHAHSATASLSRFSGQAIDAHNESLNKVHPSYRQSPLSIEFSLNSDGSVEVTKSDEKDRGENDKKVLKRSDSSSNSNNFHFSIYKWANKGMPVMVPLRSRNDSKIKEKRAEKHLNSNGSIKTDINFTELPPETPSCIDARDDKYIKIEIKEQEKELLNTSSQGILDADQCQIVEEAALSMPELESVDSLGSMTNDIPVDMSVHGLGQELTPHSVIDFSVSKKIQDDISMCTKEAYRPALKPHSVPEINIPIDVEDEISLSTKEAYKPMSKPHSVPGISTSKKVEDEVSLSTKEANKPEKKSLRSWIRDKNDQQGDEIKKRTKVKENKSKSSEKSFSLVNADKSIKKQDGKAPTSINVEADKANLQGSPACTGDRTGKNKVKGKVKEFVKIFNQEAPSKPKIDVVAQSQRFRSKNKETSKSENELHASIYKAENLSTPEVEQMVSDCFSQEVYSEKLDERNPGVDTVIPVTSHTSSKQTDCQSLESYPDCSKDTLGRVDDFLEGDFQVKELSHDQNMMAQNAEVREDFKASDSKIRKWSNGKETNIRSLLSTLQYVLWPESGWKPVPLVDIIEGNAVKRAYQRALLCLHPDKLQQKGAPAHQKYIAEKVFDILQEAWTHFSSLGSL